MEFKFAITEQPAQPVLSVRFRTAVADLPQELGRVYGAVAQYLGEMGESPSGDPFAAYYNMDMEDLDVEAGFPVTKTLPARGEIKAGEIPGSKQVSYLHKGPYPDSEPAYNAMMKWIQENNLTPTGTAYEFYLNSPLEVPESELLTKIVFPLK